MKRLPALLTLLVMPSLALAQTGQVVGYNGNATLGNSTDWIPEIQGGATAQVTTTYACGTAATGACSGGYGNVGTGSLELGVTGVKVGDQYPDWGFYYRWAGTDLQSTLAGAMSFGNLQDLTSLSFDWFRSSVDGWNDPSPAGAAPINPVDWLYKTPVVRLKLLETRIVDGHEVQTLSELVWEGYYNQESLGGETPVDTWVRQSSMQLDNFWYVSSPSDPSGTGGYSQGGSCGNAMTMWEGGVDASNSSGLFSETGCLFGATVQVIGIAVGVGSQWPLEWRGAVDNIRLGFGSTGTECATLGGSACALDANFDFTPNTTVPEPSTWALMAAGLAGLGLAARRRRTASRAVPEA